MNPPNTIASDTLVEAIARAAFRAGFHPDEDQARIDEKWVEWEDMRRLTLGIVGAALTAITEAGYAVAPVEPTKEMIVAGTTAAENVEDWCKDSDSFYRSDEASDYPVPVWKAMIRASNTGKAE